MVDGFCKTLLDKDERAKWQKLKLVLSSGARDRNALAHLSFQSEGRIDGPTTYALAPQVFVPLSMRIPRKTIDAKDATGCATPSRRWAAGCRRSSRDRRPA